MKKYFLSIVALAAMLFATSCQESLVEPQMEGPTTFTVQVPDQMGTKAIGDASIIDQLYVAVYNDAEAQGATAIYKVNVPVSGGEATVKLNLIQGQKYDIVFWAQNGESYVDADDELLSIPMNKNFHNNEAGAAFFHFEPNFEPDGFARDIELRRPFAQLNLGTTPESLITNAGNVKLNSSKIIVSSVATSFNTVTGEGVNATTAHVEYTANINFDQTLTVAGKDYVYVSMDYLPVAVDQGQDKAMVNIVATINTDKGEIVHTFNGVPVKENYRTNIVGNLISSSTDFNVVVDAEFDGELPQTAEDKLRMAAQVGGEFTLTEDIELTQPLEVKANMILDLNGKTITTAWEDEAAGKHYYAFTNRANLTIKGNGTIEARGTFNYGVLTLENGTIKAIDGNGGYAVRNYEGAEFIMNGGVIATTNEDDYKSYEGGYDATPIRVDAGAEAVINGGTINNSCDFTPVLENYGDVTINGGEFTSYWSAFNNYKTMTIKGGEVTISEVQSINGSVHPIYVGENSETTIEGGTFNARTDKPSCYSIATEDGVEASVIISGGEFSQTGGKKHFSGNKLEVEVTGGTFSYDPTDRLAEGYAALLNNANGTYTVIPTILKDGAVLDLGGVEYNGTITVEGNVTIKGDTKIKTLKSTTGCTITIEDGKILTLNNFSFGSTETAGKEYEIKGGTVVANYGFFQHGKYVLRSNFETGYMYYSYGSDITVYGTFHSQGKGDGLDYVRGKLTIATGGKSIHDKSLWVGQPEGWGPMEATLTIESGGYVQVNSLSVYKGSTLTYSNDADLKYNNVTGTEYIIKK